MPSHTKTKTITLATHTHKSYQTLKSFLSFTKGITTYCASKSALNAFAKSLRFELNKFNVPVCIINPGDYAKSTNVMTNQMTYFDQMMGSLTAEKHDLYGQAYLERFKELLLSGVGATAGSDPEKELFADFDRMVLHQNPPTEILTIVPLLNRVTLKLFFNMLPTKVQLFVCTSACSTD